MSIISISTFRKRVRKEDHEYQNLLNYVIILPVILVLFLLFIGAVTVLRFSSTLSELLRSREGSSSGECNGIIIVSGSVFVDCNKSLQFLLQ